MHVRTESELSLAWGDSCPALFVKAVQRFYAEQPKEAWTRRADLSRDGFVILIAEKRQQ